jgi:hypothetical protein
MAIDFLWVRKILKQFGLQLLLILMVQNNVLAGTLSISKITTISRNMMEKSLVFDGQVKEFSNTRCSDNTPKMFDVRIANLFKFTIDETLLAGDGLNPFLDCSSKLLFLAQSLESPEIKISMKNALFLRCGVGVTDGHGVVVNSGTITLSKDVLNGQEPEITITLLNSDNINYSCIITRPQQ